MPEYRWQFEMDADLSDAKAEEICNNLGPGGKPKTNIQIERRPSPWLAMAVYHFTYIAPVRPR